MFMVLMVVNNAYFYGVIFFPLEDESPLLIHSNTPEPFKLARELSQDDYLVEFSCR